MILDYLRLKGGPSSKEKSSGKELPLGLLNFLGVPSSIWISWFWLFSSENLWCWALLGNALIWWSPIYFYFLSCGASLLPVIYSRFFLPIFEFFLITSLFLSFIFKSDTSVGLFLFLFFGMCIGNEMGSKLI
jgi:hypothetical protein